MSYQSLYRRWRPLSFRDVVGQTHVTTILQNALIRDNVSHAYLFCGPRGTGKTTAAKILARAVNCSNPNNAEPCGECSSCQHILSGASMDVLELDAASNRGIDEIRELREKTRYAATEGRQNVYIIDEVHMLTNEAFNALLKTLEEPPPGVIFILATTEPSKLPPTIISRCQRLDFRLLTAEEIKERIEEVATREGWEYEDEALYLIAQLCEGALRDALGLMEQIYAFGDNKITAENVYALSGLAKEETLGRLVEALVQKDVVAGLNVVREITFGGKDLFLFFKEMISFFKQMLVVQSAGMEMATDERYASYLQDYSNNFSRESILEIINLLHQSMGEIRYAEHANFILEMAFLNMLRAVQNISGFSFDSLNERLERLERGQAVREVKGEAVGKEPGKKESAPASETEPKHEPTHEPKHEPTPESKPESKPKPEPAPESAPASNSQQESSSQSFGLAGNGYGVDPSEQGGGQQVQGQQVQGQQGDQGSVEEIWESVLKQYQKDKSMHALLSETLKPESMDDKALKLSCSEQMYQFVKNKVKGSDQRLSLEEVVSKVTGKALKVQIQSRKENDEVIEQEPFPKNSQGGSAEKLQEDAPDSPEISQGAEPLEFPSNDSAEELSGGSPADSGESTDDTDEEEISEATEGSAGEESDSAVTLEIPDISDAFTGEPDKGAEDGGIASEQEEENISEVEVQEQEAYPEEDQAKAEEELSSSSPERGEEPGRNNNQQASSAPGISSSSSPPKVSPEKDYIIKEALRLFEGSKVIESEN